MGLVPATGTEEGGARGVSPCQPGTPLDRGVEGVYPSLLRLKGEVMGRMDWGVGGVSLLVSRFKLLEDWRSPASQPVRPGRPGQPVRPGRLAD